MTGAQKMVKELRERGMSFELIAVKVGVLSGVFKNDQWTPWPENPSYMTVRRWSSGESEPGKKWAKGLELLHHEITESGLWG